MKKVMKLFLMLVLGVMIALTSTQVLADDFDDQFENAIDVSNSTEENKTNDEEDLTNTNTNSNANKNTNTNSNTNTTNTNTNSDADKNSTYNNTNLPKTGIEDAMPMVALVVIFGISAVYAYKKVNDYKNI